MSTRRSKLPEDQPPETLEIEAEDVTEETEAEAIAPQLPPEAFAFNRGRCGVCSEKISTNLEGALFCPAQRSDCPRYIEEKK